MILLPALLIAAASARAAGPDWEQVRDAEGIQIFVAREADQPIVIVKAVAVIDAEFGRIKAILDDVPGRAAWVPYLAQSRVLAVLSPSEELHYDRFNAPWPARDRDFVYRVTVARADERGIVYEMRSEPSALMPEQRGIIRAELMESSYALSTAGGGRTRVELIFHADPRGWLPLWIVNIIQRGFPFQALKGLRAQAGAAYETPPPGGGDGRD